MMAFVPFHNGGYTAAERPCTRNVVLQQVDTTSGCQEPLTADVKQTFQLHCICSFTERNLLKIGPPIIAPEKLGISAGDYHLGVFWVYPEVFDCPRHTVCRQVTYFGNTAPPL